MMRRSWRFAVVVVAAVLAGWAMGPPGVQAAEDGRPPAQARDQAETQAIPPRNSGPAARAHSRYRRGRHGTTRIIRRTPEVMREDAARVKRGDLFGTWSNEYLK